MRNGLEKAKLIKQLAKFMHNLACSFNMSSSYIAHFFFQVMKEKMKTQVATRTKDWRAVMSLPPASAASCLPRRPCSHASSGSSIPRGGNSHENGPHRTNVAGSLSLSLFLLPLLPPRGAACRLLPLDPAPGSWYRQTGQELCRRSHGTMQSEW